MSTTAIRPEVEVDTRIAAAFEVYARAAQWADAMDRTDFRGRPLYHPDVVAEAKAEAAQALEAYLAAAAEYAGWSRFFLVTNTNGHIHRSMDCHTCFNDTRFAWLPELSGLTEADAVEAHGEILCSVCFPSAPVAWTTGVSKATLAARAERDAAKVERQAKKVAKALIPEDPDGGLQTYDDRGRREDRIKTIAAAKQWLTSAAYWNRDGRTHPSYPVNEVLRVVEALAARTGEEPEAVIAAAVKRAAKR